MVKRDDIMNPNEVQHFSDVQNMTCSANLNSEHDPFRQIDLTATVNQNQTLVTIDTIDTINTNEKDYYEWSEREVSYLQYSYFIGYIGKISLRSHHDLETLTYFRSFKVISVLKAHF